MMNVTKTSKTVRIGHFTVVYLIAKPLIWSEAEVDLVVIDQYLREHDNIRNLHLKNSKVCIIISSPLASLLLKATKHITVNWTIIDRFM